MRSIAVAVPLAALVLTSIAQAQQSPLDRYVACITPILERYTKYMDALAVMYPRFGIAWGELKRETETNTYDQANNRPQSYPNAYPQFIDRVLKTAEPEAVQDFQLAKMASDQKAAVCGPVPQVQAP